MKIALLPFYLELYDQVKPEIRDKMQAFAQQVCEQLRGLGFEVKLAPICRVESEFIAAVESIEQEQCRVICTLHLAYSPSLESAAVLAKSKLPLVLLDTSPSAKFDERQPDAIMLNHGIHGVQDLCNLLLRHDKPFLLLAGHWQSQKFLQEARKSILAAGMQSRLCGMRIGNVGGQFEGMGDFQFEAGSFGLQLCSYQEQAEPSESEIEAEIAADLQRYQPSDSLNREALRRSVKAGLKLRRWLESEKLEAFTVCFPGITKSQGWDTVPFLECSKAMSRGLGYAGEGDLLTAGVNRCLAEVFPETSFSEMFCPDWQGQRIFTSHMAEINTSLCVEKALLHEMQYGYSDTCNPVIATGCFKPGQALIVNLAPGAQGQFSLIAAEVEFLPEENPGNPTANRGWFRPLNATVEEFLCRYSELGGTHHLALCYGGEPEIMQKWAKLMKWKYYKI